MKFEKFITEAYEFYPKYSQTKMLAIAKRISNADDYRHYTNKTIKFKRNGVYFLMQGIAEVSHRMTGKTIGRVKAPFPIGFVELHYGYLPLDYKLIGECRIILLKEEQLKKFLSYPTVVTGLLSLLKYYLYCLSIYNDFMQNGPAYSTLRTLIYLYEINCRHQMSNDEKLILYIMKRTSFSRSHIFRIVSELKRGGYISQPSKGIFVINKPLPYKHTDISPENNTFNC